MANGLADGNLDVALWNGSFPLPPVKKLIASRKVKLIPIPDDFFAKHQAQYPPYARLSIPGGTYNGIDNDTPSFSLANGMVISKDVPEDLVYSISGGSDIVAELVGTTITFTAAQDFYGSEEFTATVADDLASDSQTFTVTVNAVNDAPVLAAVTNVSFDEDGSGSTTLSGSDVDLDGLTYSISGGSEATISAELVGTTVTFTPFANYNGSETFTATVTDGEFVASQTFTVTVNAVNDAPTLAAVDAVSFDEDGSGSTTLTGSDIDSNSLTYSVSSGTDITASVDGATVSFSAPANFNGSESFTATVTDGEFSASQIFTVTVNAVNDEPTLAAVDAVSFDEDGSTSIALSGSDIDSSGLAYSVSTGTDIAAAVNGFTVTFTASQDFNGSESFTATVSDGEYTSSQTFTVTVNAVNDAPTLAAVDAVSFDEDGSGSTTLSFAP